MKSKVAVYLFLLAVSSMASGTVKAQFAPYPVPPPGQFGVMPAGGAPGGYVLQAIPADSNPVIPAAALMAGGGGESCADACSTCDGSCGGKCAKCCVDLAGYCHCFYFYGDFLYLRGRDSEVVWGTPANSNFPVPPNAGPVQVGPLGVLDVDYQPGFRVGFQYNFDECSGFSAQYTMFEATTNDHLAVVGAVPVIYSNVSHPGIQNTAVQAWRQGDATYSINYDKIDFDYHKLLWYDYDYQIGYLAGVGFVQMEQQLGATFQGNGSERTTTDIDFYGIGARFGLEGEGGGVGGFRLYGKAIGSLNAGEFRADYVLTQTPAANNPLVTTNWHGGRIVGIWDLEMGVKWISCCGNYSANVGYMYSAWTNTVQTDQWIRGVQTNGYTDLDDTMTFDGLVARFEARF